MGIYPSDRLENSEIKKILVDSGQDGALVDEVLKQLWFKDWFSTIVSYRPYFELLKRFLLSHKIKTFNRKDFYKYIFDQKIKGDKYKELQQIALYFESIHSDRMILNEYKKVVKTLGLSPYFATSFIDSLDLTYTEGDEKTKQKMIIWRHHTLTEYLSSDYILNAKDPVKEAEDRMVYKERGFVGFKNSWYGTLRFILESEIAEKFVNWLIGLAEKHPDNIDDDFSQIILSINPKKIKTDTKSTLFELVYNHYKKQTVWLPAFTRQFIGNFVQQKHLSILKKDINEQGTDVKTYVFRGNVVSVIDSLFENKSDLLTKDVKNFWKGEFIKFANDKNENGVLQRHALDVLVHYKDSSLIPLLSGNFKHHDNLVREAFVRFCYETDPDSKSSIDYQVEAIKSGIVIYGRYGLYEITSIDGILYLLEKFTKDQEFLRIFIDRETIFSDKKDHGDSVLIENISKTLNKDKLHNVVKALENMLLEAFKGKDRFHLERSSFMQEISKLIRNYDDRFVFKLLDQTKAISTDQDRLFNFYTLENILPFLITKSNLIEFSKLFKDYPVERSQSTPQKTIYSAKRLLGEYGDSLYQFAVENNLVDKISDTVICDKYTSFSEGEDKYKEFQKQLVYKEGRFLTSIFNYFVDYKDEILKFITPKEKSILKKIINVVLKFDTKTLKVKLESRSDKSKFNWSTIASYYGDALRAGQILIPRDILKYRQNIINLIPFSFTDNQMSIIEFVKKASDSELEFVYKTYSNKDNDLRYFMPSSFNQVVSSFQENGSNLKKAGDVILSLASDSIIGTYDRIEALDKYKLFASMENNRVKDILKKIEKEHDSIEDVEKSLALTANAILIEKFKDNESINWRFDELKRRVFKFKKSRKLEAHEVTPHEEELDTLSIGAPLINTADPNLQSKFIELLDFSFEVLRKRDDDYWSYVHYLWKIAIAYFEKLASLGSIKPYLDLLDWANKNIKSDKSNWFYSSLKTLRNFYINTLGKK